MELRFSRLVTGPETDDGVSYAPPGWETLAASQAGYQNHWIAKKPLNGKF
jgi:hypothetical protein